RKPLLGTAVGLNHVGMVALEVARAVQEAVLDQAVAGHDTVGDGVDLHPAHGDHAAVVGDAGLQLAAVGAAEDLAVFDHQPVVARPLHDSPVDQVTIVGHPHIADRDVVGHHLDQAGGSGTVLYDLQIFDHRTVLAYRDLAAAGQRDAFRYARGGGAGKVRSRLGRVGWDSP